MIVAAVVGLLAGVLSGLVGVGGGILFVPALVFGLGLGQLHAEATSLLATVPVAIVGAARQHRYGNVRVREALVTGVLALAGVGAGVAAANHLPEHVLRRAFGAMVLVIGARLAVRSIGKLRERRRQADS